MLSSCQRCVCVLVLLLLMAGDKSGASSLFRRAEQLKRWQESDTNKQEYCEKPKNATVTFSDACIFLAAASAGDEEELIRLLGKGADINAENPDGITALHSACIDNNLSVAEFLVDSGADINWSDMEGWTPLHATASCGSLTMAKFLIERGSDLALVNNDGNLAIDCVEEQPAMTALLQQSMIERGVDGKMARSKEEKCMLDDIADWMHDGIIDDVPHPKTGATALHVAAAKGYIEVIRLLLDAGVNVNSTDLDGWTPLHAAVHWEQTEAVELLCDSNADLDIINIVGQTPIDLAAPNIKPLISELKRKQLADRRSRKHKSSPSGRESNKQRKESHTHNREAENGPKENPTENGKVVNSSSLDASEIQSWRRPSSMRSSKSKDAPVTGREPLTERSLSSPNHRDEPPSNTTNTTASPIRRTMSFDRENRNTRDSMMRVTALQDGLLQHNSTTTTTTTTTTSNSTSTATEAFIIPTTTTTLTSSSSSSNKNNALSTSNNNNISNINSSGTTTTTTTTSNISNSSISTTTTTTAAPSIVSSTIAATTSSPSTSVSTITTTTTTDVTATSASNNTNHQQHNTSTTSSTSSNSSVSPSRVVGRSFVPPSRDDESETQRKANARLIRSSRRSTQGVSLDDLKTAETLFKPGSEAAADKVSTTTTSTTSSSSSSNDTAATSTVASTAASNGPRNSRQEDEERRPSWRLKVDDHDKNKFCLEDVRGKESNGVQIRPKSSDEKKDEDPPPRTSSGIASASQSREGSLGAIQRKKKPKRRSTGVVHVDMDEILLQQQQHELQKQQQQQQLAGNSTNVSDRDGSKTGSAASSRASSNAPEGDIDYKKLYEGQLEENERLVERLQGYEQDLRSARDAADTANRQNSSKLATAESDRREKRALERKLSEMEEELRVMEQMRQDNKKLRDENGALIRVISKLSR